MKKLILIFIVLPFISKSQIQVQEQPKKTTIGQVKSLGFKYYELEESAYKTDTIYSLTYLNKKYTHIKDYQTLLFSGKRTINDLDSLVANCFKESTNKDYKVSFDIFKDHVIIEKQKTLGVTEAIISSDLGWFHINENQYKKLFGKK